MTQPPLSPGLVTAMRRDPATLIGNEGDCTVIERDLAGVPGEGARAVA